MLDISKIKYPEMTNLLNLKPSPHIILGRELVIQEKRDGSNIGVYLDDAGFVHLRSRNMDKASDDFYIAFDRTKEVGGVIDLLHDAANWNKDYVIFGEMLLKGKSPTRTEYHDNDEFVVFDIWDAAGSRWLSYTEVYQQCYHFKIPVVELYGTARVSKISSLIEFKNKMLEIAFAKEREGVVIKAYGSKAGEETIFCKEKHDMPKFEEYPRVEEGGKLEFPELPDSEVMGAIEKVRTDIGDEKFLDKKIVMPMIAKYVGAECEKHICSMPKKSLFSYYQRRLEDICGRTQ